MYEIFEKLCQSHKVTPYRVCKETGLTTATISNWKAGRYTPKADKLQKIADYFGVTIEYLMTGKENGEKSSELTARDERDIAKDLDRIMGEIRKGDDGPLYYNGIEIDNASLSLLENAIEYALKETKKENKVKYNPNKNKK
ncbi:helix-turn-helix domain-containing protein [Enterocloster sp.]|uniref:helix-turn-helix domain-containing protein n=1 Tax=Enterocloster sp. TaxID=2719315 RepID=UPI0039BC63FB